MNRINRAILAVLLTCGLATSMSFAQGDKPVKPATPSTPTAPAAAAQPKPDMKMPSPEEMKKMQEMMAAYETASKPGKQHEVLMKGVGKWDGKVKSYEMPGQPPVESACVMNTTSILGGRFTHAMVSGDMGSMGHFEGSGIYGYDVAAGKYTMCWIDSMGTGIMNGTGELSADGKKMTWTMHYTDPMTKKDATMREVDTFISEDHTTLEMYGPNPMEGMKEMKMMEIDSTRIKGDAPAKPDMNGPAKKPEPAPAKK